MACRRCAAKAFSLVELLVVIAVIGILVAIALPAIQSARERARRATCANNIWQLTRAVQGYRTENQDVFPINWGVCKAAKSRATCDTDDYGGLEIIGHSWLTMILPFIEQEVLYKSISFGRDLTTVSNERVARTRIPTFLCPSDTHDGGLEKLIVGTTATGVWGTTNYKACNGMNWPASVDESGNPQNGPMTWPKGRSAGSSDGFEYGSGPICRNRLDTAPPPPPQGTVYTKGLPGLSSPPFFTVTRDVRDGMANTFLIGEALPQICRWSAWYWWDGVTATCAIPLNYKLPLGSSEDRTDWKWTYSFMSRHVGGGNFALCDGSVHYVSDGISSRIYRALATIDGEDSLTLTKEEMDEGREDLR